MTQEQSPLSTPVIIRRYSPSMIRNFRTCPRRAIFTYAGYNVRRDTAAYGGVNANTEIGKLFHIGAHVMVYKGNVDKGVSAMRSALDELYDTVQDRTVVEVDVLPYAHNMFMNFCVWLREQNFFDRYSIIGSEVNMTLKVDELPAPFYQYADLVLFDNEAKEIVIVDYKTSNTTSGYLHPMDPQMMMYAMLWTDPKSEIVVHRSEEDDVDVRYEWDRSDEVDSGVLTVKHITIKRLKDNGRAKRPFVDYVDARITAERVATFRSQLLPWIAQEVEAKSLDGIIAFPAYPGKHCTFYGGCTYKPICEDMDDPTQDWSYLLENYYELVPWEPPSTDSDDEQD
jgi:hypothetical protein